MKKKKLIKRYNALVVENLMLQIQVKQLKLALGKPNFPEGGKLFFSQKEPNGNAKKS